MKKVTLLLGLALFFMSGINYAHGPSNIDVEYDKVTGMVNVNVTHPVEDVGTHYVETIEIMYNGEKIIEQKFNFQQNNNGQSAVYLIPGMEAGDALVVEGYCSQSGELEEEIDIK